jgi:myo-inositol-1(or 4)-monophosphatase
VTEAGGLIGNFTGESDFLEQKECVAGNPRVYGQLVSLLGKYSKFATAGEKATVRQAQNLVPPDTTPTADTKDASPDTKDATDDAPF